VPTRYSLFNLSIGKKGQQKNAARVGIALDGFLFPQTKPDQPKFTLAKLRRKRQEQQSAE